MSDQKAIHCEAFVMLRFRHPACYAALLLWGLSVVAFGNSLEEQIRSGAISTSRLIVPDHPRLWIRGSWDWDHNNTGSFAWRILHGQQLPWPWMESPANDQAKGEFSYSAGADDADDYGADNMFQSFAHDFGIRFLEPCIAGKAQKLNWRSLYAGTYTSDHSADEYFADARNKLIYVVDLEPAYEFPYVATLFGAVGYDWLVNETYTDGRAVLSEADKAHIQSQLMIHADFLMNRASRDGYFFKATDTDNYYYIMVGLALYEPTKVNDGSYAAINAKAQAYLDAFDAEFIGKVLVAWNAQGEDGGWHGGLNRTECPFWIGGGYETNTNVAVLTAAPLLFAHYTATGSALESSLFNTGVLRHFVEFQAHMIRPSDTGTGNGTAYFEIGGVSDSYSRSPWVMPMRAYSRRRFSAEAEQLKLAELGAWLRTSFNKTFTDYGSWDMTDQLLFEDKWVNPHSPEEIGFATTRHFEKLGWVFMRTGFTSRNDLAALFICQRYHWSHLDPYAQNSFTLERKGKLIEGFNNTIKIDDQAQRSLSPETFPKISQGVQAYRPGSAFDVGPGITKFESTEKYDYVIGDATNAYDRNKVQKYTRQFVFLKPDKFVIFDRVITREASSKKSWIIKPGAATKVQGHNLTLIDNGAGALWIKRLLPMTATETINSDRIEIVPTEHAQEHVFLHVLQTAESGQSQDAPNIKVDEAESFSLGNWVGITIGEDSVQFDVNGGVKISSRSVPTGVKSSHAESVPLQFNLGQNLPNPFSSTTQICYEINRDAEVELIIFTLLGQRVITLLRGRQKAGPKTVRWNGKDESGNAMPAGLYIYRLLVETQVQFKKMLVLR